MHTVTELNLSVLVWIVCLAGVWASAVIVYGITSYWSNGTVAKLVGKFKRRFPHQCFLCSYYRNIMMEHPPEHDCGEWRDDL